MPREYRHIQKHEKEILELRFGLKTFAFKLLFYILKYIQIYSMAYIDNLVWQSYNKIVLL